MQVGDKAVQAIVGFEIGSTAYYEQCLKHPIWPGGASGVTIGIGYDLGQHTAAEITADWSPHVDPDTARYLSHLAGIKGDGARIRAAGLGGVSVPLPAATSVFSTSTLPKYAAGTAASLPNCSQLQPDAFGALVSLSYNRGYGGYTAAGDEFEEMRMIRAAMEAGDFADIPNQIRAMCRLWKEPNGTPKPGMAGVIARREEEAALFAAAQPTPAPTPAPTPVATATPAPTPTATPAPATPA